MRKIGAFLIVVIATLVAKAQDTTGTRLSFIGNIRLIDKVHYEIGALYNITPKYAFALYMIPGFFRKRNLDGNYFDNGYLQNYGYGSGGNTEVFDPFYTVKFITIRPSFLVKREMEKRTAYNGIGVNWTRSKSELEIEYHDPIFPDRKDIYSNSIQTFSVEFTHMQLFKLSPNWSISGTFLLGAHLYENPVANKEQSLKFDFGTYNPGEGFLQWEYLYFNLLIGVQWRLK